ncbi:protein cereblon [Nilaparvata lugens]|uniref:protein cereblon n=1 Tax=Nilaparvata lugens TaxID=108931 RepID=UPI00193D710A|nr:protein cereblon [Nilaparvata lugens]
MDQDYLSDSASSEDYTNESNVAIAWVIPRSLNASLHPDSSDEEQNDYIRSNFDKMLPSEHCYLGDEMEECRGRTIWEDNSVQTLVLLPPPSIVLVPGQVLPLTVNDRYTIRMLEHCIDQYAGMFGVIVKWPRPGHKPDESCFGTTVEIYEYHRVSDDIGETSQLSIKAKARQRFHTLELEKAKNGGLYQARIQIMPEVTLPDTLYHVFPHINRYLSSKSDCFRRRGAMTTRWPLWVYDQYHPPKLVERVEKELDYLKGETPFIQFSMFFSYSVMDFTFMAIIHLYQCSNCQNEVGHQRDVIAMSVDGPQNTYVNPNGHLHETLTMSKAYNLLLSDDEPTLEFSWFPGYAWVVAFCSNCHIHLGWKFLAQKDDLLPKSFWGLTRRSLQFKIHVTSESPDIDFQFVM